MTVSFGLGAFVGYRVESRPREWEKSEDQEGASGRDLVVSSPCDTRRTGVYDVGWWNGSTQTRAKTLDRTEVVTGTVETRLFEGPLRDPKVLLGAHGSDGDGGSTTGDVEGNQRSGPVLYPTRTSLPYSDESSGPGVCSGPVGVSHGIRVSRCRENWVEV